MTISLGSAAAQHEERVLRDLIRGLSGAAQAPGLSVGLVGQSSGFAPPGDAAQVPQPPAHCLCACLNGDAGAAAAHGCPYLTGAGDARGPGTSRCARGFRVTVQPAALGERPAVLLVVEGELGPTPEAVVRRSTPHLPPAALLDRVETIGRVVRDVGQLLEENAGFADEVLRSYEQLNFIFDLTQQIAQVLDAREIEQLLLQRVARLLAAQAVFVASPEGEWRAFDTAGGARAAPGAAATLQGRCEVELRTAAETVDLVRRTRRVQVTALGARPVIAAPLVHLDDRVDVVLAVRPEGAATFTSTDMMMIASALTFGGQLISNGELHERLRTMSLEVTRALVAAIDQKDHYTRGHSERVGMLSRLVGRELGLSRAELQDLEWAGLLHDVGKIGIPEVILSKPGRLSLTEFESIKRHPRIGYEILRPIASFERVLTGVLHHHEQPDGNGYPSGLRGDAVPLIARIIHVADTFDALTSTRSYRRAFQVERACEIMRQDAGSRLDAGVIDVFLRVLEAYRQADPGGFAANFIAQREFEDVESGRPTVYAGGQSG